MGGSRPSVEDPSRLPHKKRNDAHQSVRDFLFLFGVRFVYEMIPLYLLFLVAMTSTTPPDRAMEKCADFYFFRFWTLTIACLEVIQRPGSWLKGDLGNVFCVNGDPMSALARATYRAGGVLNRHTNALIVHIVHIHVGTTAHESRKSCWPSRREVNACG